MTISRQTRDRLLTQLAKGEIAPEKADPNHHLWQRDRMWWTTLTFDDHGKPETLQRGLATADVAEARKRRDALIRRLADEGTPLLD